MDFLSKNAPIIHAPYLGDNIEVMRTVPEILSDFFKREVGTLMTTKEVDSWYIWVRWKGIVKLSDLVCDAWESLIEKNAREMWKHKSYYSSLFFIENQKKDNHTFSLISNKNKIIEKNINRWKYEVLADWRIFDHEDYELLLQYYISWYLKYDEVRLWFREFIFERWSDAIRKISIPKFERNGKERDLYFTMDHDILPEDKKALAFWLFSWWYDTEENEIIKRALERWGYTKATFYWMYLDKNLLNTYINNLLNIV